MDTKLLRKRLQTLENSRQTIEQQWELIREFVVPYRGRFFKDQRQESSVEWRENRRVFDSTAINANNTLSSSLHGGITNPSIQWFGFKFRRDELTNNPEAAQWLRDCGQITFEALRDSNFNLEANEAYIDLTSFGTAFVSKEVLETNEQDLEDFLFQGIPIDEAFFEQDYRGRICYFYRRMKWSAMQIFTKFGDKTPQKIKERAQQNSTDADISIIFAIYKRNGYRDPTKVSAADQRQYGYRYFLEDNAEQLGEEGGYYTMPALVMRWRKTANSMWGNSPAMIALPDILTANELVEMTLQSLEKVIDPAVMTTERGLLTDLDLGPGGLNVLREMGEMEAFESRARFDVAELRLDDLRSSIRSIFYVDQLELKDSPAMTATEVQVRYELMQRLLGPTLGRLESDFLDPLVSSTFADLFRYKKFPDPPQVIADAGDPTMNIEYTGPMSRAQKQDQVASVERFIGGVSALAEVNPEVLDKVDFDAAVELMAEYNQVEPKMLASEAKVKKTRKERKESQERAQEAALQQAEGEADQATAEGGAALTAVPNG